MKLKWPPKSFPGILKVLLNKDYKSIWRFKGYGKVNSTEKKKNNNFLRVSSYEIRQIISITKTKYVT